MTVRRSSLILTALASGLGPGWGWVGRVWGQVQVTVSPIAKPAAQRMLSKRVAKVAMPWTVALENTGAETVAISESAILRRIAHLSPLDHQTMSLLIAEGDRNNPWARVGRAAEDVTKLGAFLAASKNVRWGDSVLTGLTGALALSPYVLQRIRGAATPVQQNFESLAWVAPVRLDPGESTTARVFTVKWDAQPQTVVLVIDVTKVKAVKAIQ